MDKRFITFLVLSMAVLLGWSALHQALFPPPPLPADNGAVEVADDKPKDAAPREERNDPEIAEIDAPDEPKPQPQEAEPTEVAESEPDEQGPPPQVEAASEPPLAHFELGSPVPESGYPFLVTLTNRGAALETMTLNDPRYRQVENPKKPLDVVSLETEGEPSLLLTLEGEGARLAERNWEVRSREQDENGVENAIVFRTEWTEGGLAVEKHYRVQPGPDAYTLQLTIRFENLSEDPQQIAYTLTGPNGLPLEGLEYARTFREVAVAFFNDDSEKVDASSLDVSSLVDQVQSNSVENWTEKPLKYVGVITPYFASALIPGGDQRAERWDERSRPIVVGLPKGESGRETNISAEIHSRTFVIEPSAEGILTHEYTLFAGPKDPELLAAHNVSSLLDYGMLGFISRPMVALLNFFYGIVGNYGVAIIMLTVLVRLSMFPLSRKQVIASIKMQELKPELDKLKEKYKNDKEKIGRATMDLYRKHGVNPLGGCLPLVVQMPIFIGLYWSLSLSVDLRLASFLYIDNLAAPDHLWNWGVQVPFLGPYLNLLPIITVILFVVQQKMFVPPATDEQTAMQQKIMSYMMIFIGFMFYHVASGLCLYFIASSLWSVAEKKLMPKPKAAPPPPTPQERRKKKDRPLSGSKRS